MALWLTEANCLRLGQAQLIITTPEKKNGSHRLFGVRSYSKRHPLTRGSLTVPTDRQRPRFLCLHGFRTSGEIMRKQVLGKWPDRVTSRLDLFFADAPFPAEGKSEVEGIFDPPYYEWFQFNEGFKDLRNFDECLAYIEDLMIKHGPFDGLMGFSQGAVLSATLPGFQAKGLALKRVPQVKNVVLIGGAKLPVVEKAFDVKIKCPSLHFIGDLDFFKEPGEALLEAFVDPFVVRHSRGHTVPRLDDKSLETVLGYIDRIEKNMDEETELSLSLSVRNPLKLICLALPKNMATAVQILAYPSGYKRHNFLCSGFGTAASPL